MKNKSLLILLLLCANFAYSQQDSITIKIISIFEVNCPYYVLENYCAKGGLEDIVKKAKVDDRVSKITKIAATHEVEARDSSIKIHYNNSIIIFEKYKDSWDVAPFMIIVKNKRDLEYLGMSYGILMGYTKDNEAVKKDGLTTKYFHKEYPMNSILTYEYPQKKSYYANCFVWQYGFCN